MKMRHNRFSPGLYRCLRQPRLAKHSRNKAGLKTAAGRVHESPQEEGKYSFYDPKIFYPARIGETLGGKYRLISKLGWGTGSTVWLAGEAPR